MKKVVDFTQFEEKKTHISLCIIVHLCTIATVSVHICTGTVALPFNILMFPFIILMFLFVWYKKQIFHTFHWQATTPTPQLSPYFILELPLIFSLRLILAHCHHHRKLCDRFGVFVAPWVYVTAISSSLTIGAWVWEREAVSCQSELNDRRWLGLPLLLCAHAQVQCLP